MDIGEFNRKADQKKKKAIYANLQTIGLSKRPEETADEYQKRCHLWALKKYGLDKPERRRKTRFHKSA